MPQPNWKRSISFNSMGNQTFVHTLVKATAATTPIFNGFFASMESTFGYGFKDPDSWWDLKNEPTYGVHPNFMRY